MKTRNLFQVCALLCATLSTFLSHAQGWIQGSGTMTTTDRVGIGTSTVSSNINLQVGGTDATIQLGSNSTASDNYYWRNTVNFGTSGRGLHLFTGSPGSNPIMTVKSTGFIGIGTDNPTANFQVYNTSSNPSFKIGTHVGTLVIGSSTCDACLNSFAKRGDAVLRTTSSGSTPLDMKNNMILSTSSTFNTGKSIYLASESHIMLAVNDNNTVGIGTATIPSGYRLGVNGKMICEEVKVQLKVNWPDYVFNKNYKLKDLSEVESFIHEYNHLPGMPSAKEVEKNGIALGEMNAKLLEKVEELTLYVIELEKKVKALERK